MVVLVWQFLGYSMCGHLTMQQSGSFEVYVQQFEIVVGVTVYHVQQRHSL